MVSAPLALAAGLVVLLGAVHSIAGEILLLGPTDRAAGPPRLLGSELFARRTHRLVWHATTLLALAIAAILGRAATMPVLGASDVFAIRAIAVAMAACAALSLGASRGMHPAWIAFGVIAALSWAATT